MTKPQPGAIRFFSSLQRKRPETDLWVELMDPWMAEAISEARAGFAEGGAPVGAVLVKTGAIVGRGRNRLYQTGDPTTHAEMEAYRDAAVRAEGKQIPEEVDVHLAGCAVYTTAAPCEMCAGTLIRFAATHVGETTTYPAPGTIEFMRRQGIHVVVLEVAECIRLVEQYFRRYPERQHRWVTPRLPALRL
jgi:cytosine/creatinine deaminase